jgi:hypothetical protein
VVTEAAPVAVDEPRPDARGIRLAASPNPFISHASLTFTLPEASRVRLELFDVAGRRVLAIADEILPAGPHTRRFDAEGLRAGIYYARLVVADRSSTWLVRLIGE